MGAKKGRSMTLLELVQQTGISPKWAASTAGGEYHSPCPVCGGIDRFYIQPNRQMTNCLGSYYCRKCNTGGDSIKFARQFLNCSFHEAIQLVNATVPQRVSFMPFRNTKPKKVVLQQPSNKWIMKASQFVDNAYMKLLQKPGVLTYLANRGLSLDAVRQYKLGWNDRDIFLPRENWGLDKQVKQDGSLKKLWLPQGLVIPTFESKDVVRLKIRRQFKKGDKLPKYVVISGSMNGLTILGSSKHSTMIVVESELDAFATNFVTHDFACVVAVGSNIKNPDNVTDYIAKKVKHVLICHDNDEAGRKMLTKWQRLYSHAQPYPTPIGKDIGEAIQQGLNIREWLQSIICKKKPFV